MAMRYDALNVGSGEQRAGPTALRHLAESSAPTLVSSNARLVPASTGSGDSPPTPKPYLIREVGGVRVGIVGVTSPVASGDASGGGNLTPALTSAPTPIIEALRALLPEIRRQADVIVVLADLEPAEAQELAAAGLDIEVVLGGRVLQSEALTRVGQTVVVAVGGDGRYVGKLTLQVNASGKVVSAEHVFGFLDQGVEDDPSLVALRAEYQ